MTAKAHSHPSHVFFGSWMLLICCRWGHRHILPSTSVLSSPSVTLQPSFKSNSPPNSSSSTGIFFASAMSTTANNNMSSNKIRIVSYNVLSSKLSRPEHFTHSDPEHLEYEYRLPLILKKLEEEMDRGFVEDMDIDEALKRGSDYIGEIDAGEESEGKETKESSESNDAVSGEKEKDSENKDEPSLTENETQDARRTSTQTAPPTIFCLQEVCYPFASALHTFFAQRGYHFITGLYGKKFNGYMGIAIAYPLKNFETIKVDIARLSDERDGGWPRPPSPPEQGASDEDKHKNDPSNEGLTSFDNLQMTSQNDHTARMQKIIRKITESLEKFTAHTVQSTVDFVRNRIDKPIGIKFRLALGLPPMEGEKEEKPIDPWDMSENRFNVLLTVVLRCAGSNDVAQNSNGMFSISNYHMPCAFYAPPVMNIHAEMAARRVQHLAAEAWKDVSGKAEGSETVGQPASIPHIFAGDFNILPDSPHYNLLTTATLDKSDPTYPPGKHDMEWTIGSVAMDSAYAVKDPSGSEPEFTNYAHIREDEDPFIGTLDYIFLSKKESTVGGSGEWWKVHDVKGLPATADSGGPFPNEVEPSDHVLIAADLELLSTSTTTE